MFFYTHRKDGTAHSIMLRGMAVFFAALYMLSAVRGLVPGMCATQTAVAHRNPDHYAPACAIQQTKSCCPGKGIAPVSNTSEQDAPLPAVSCMFCVIAKALVKSVEHYHYEAPEFAPEFAPTETPTLACVADTPSTLRDRAPPAA